MSNTDPYTSFMERYTGADGNYGYLELLVDATFLGYRMSHPPLVGDLVVLRDLRDGNTKSYRVVDRRWTYPQYGSHHWPTSDTDPSFGPRLEVVVEAAGELYSNAVETDL